MYHKFYGSLNVIKKLVLIIFYVKKERSHVSFLQKGWRFWQRHTCGPSKKIREKVCRIEYEFSKDIWGYSLEGNIQKKSRKVEKEERKVANHFPPPLVVKKWVGEQKSTTSHKNHSKSHEISPPPFLLFWLRQPVIMTILLAHFHLFYDKWGTLCPILYTLGLKWV